MRRQVTRSSPAPQPPPPRPPSSDTVSTRTPTFPRSGRTVGRGATTDSPTRSERVTTVPTRETQTVLEPAKLLKYGSSLLSRRGERFGPRKYGRYGVTGRGVDPFSLYCSSLYDREKVICLKKSGRAKKVNKKEKLTIKNNRYFLFFYKSRSYK